MNKDLKVGRRKKRPAFSLGGKKKRSAFSFAGAEGRLPPRPQKRREFLRVANTGDRIVTPGIILQRGPVLGPDELSKPNRPPRIGYTASRKVGNAIARNKAKRRMREIARLMLQTRLPADRDYVLVGRRAAIRRPLARMARDIEKALEKSGWCEK